MRRPDSVFVSARGRRRAVAVLLAYLLVAAFVTFGLPRLFPAITDPVAVRRAIRATGVLAPVVFLAVQALQVLVAPIPGQVLGFVAGYLFGAVWGTVLSVAGATLGGYIAFLLSRRYGRPIVERLVRDDAIALFDSFSAEHGDVALFVVFLVPGLPDDAICFLAGVSDLRTRSFLIASVLGRLPGYFLVALAGARLAEARTAETAVLLVALAVVSTLGYLARERISRWLGDGSTASEP
ncbi:TVP38/TMEM64 family protein [Salinigranum sp. GCM10025319]|uniref:TVP38/TMEM64 family protein n=1 Tax=Salinigranum sp. GCM10025319 TaxID=3252687 RepID=UPI00360F5F0B